MVAIMTLSKRYKLPVWKRTVQFAVTIAVQITILPIYAQHFAVLTPAVNVWEATA